MLFGKIGLAVAFSLGAVASAIAQPVFSYTANDHRGYTLSGGGPVSIPVTTLVIIQGDPNAPIFPEPIRMFRVNIRPPEVAEPRMLQAFVDNQGVKLNILKSNLDGEMEAIVEIPVSAGPSPDLKIYWSTKDAGPLEMTLKPSSDNFGGFEVRIPNSISGLKMTRVHARSTMKPAPHGMSF